MKVFIQGKNSIDLNKNDYIAQGGEGEIYGKGNTIFKIYLDSSKMIKSAKINELSKIKSNNILKPNDIILNDRNKEIGFTMNWVKNTYPMCKLFTNSFRNKNNIKSKIINDLVLSIKENTHRIHEANCLIVDGNEFNYLVSDDFKTPYFIDVDSYQTKSFPATAIMPSIVDYHSNNFSELTDWFSFAIIACQLFIGIHPYKGSHPNYKKRDMEKRMKDNISIFNNETSLPPSVRNFDLIPKNWFNWFVNVLEKGNRESPPSEMNNLIAVANKTLMIKSTEDFIIQMKGNYKDDILFYKNIKNKIIVKTKKHIIIDNIKHDCDINTELIFIEKSLQPIFVKIEQNQLVTKYKNDITYHKINCQDKLIIDNQLFIKNKGKISHIIIKEVSNKLLIGVGMTWNIMENSNELFGNIIYHNILGKTYLFIPLSSSLSVNKPIPELDKCKIINMKYMDNVCIGVNFKNNKYFRFVIIFDSDHNIYDYREFETDMMDVNFTVLPNEVTVSISNEGEFELFINNVGINKVRKIKNKNITSDMILCNDFMSMMFFKENKLYSLSLKK